MVGVWVLDVRPPLRPIRALGKRGSDELLNIGKAEYDLPGHSTRQVVTKLVVFASAHGA